MTLFGCLVLYFFFVHAQGAARRCGGLIALACAMSCLVCVACRSWNWKRTDGVQSQVCRRWRRKGRCARELEVSQKLRRLQIVRKDKDFDMKSQDWPRLT